MKTYAEPHLPLPRSLLRLAFSCCLLLVPLFAQAAITVTRTSGPMFLTDSGAGAVCNYVSFDATSSTTVDDVWLTITPAGGGFLALGGGDNGSTHFGPMTAGQTRSAFFYICSTFVGSGGTKTSTGSYDITAYSGNPAFGGSVIGPTPTNFTTVIDDGTIAASQNTVNAIWADINPSVLGATTTLTVDGDTGSIGCTNSASMPYSTCTGGGAGTKGPLTFTPAAFTNWRADAYELVGASIVLSVGNTGTYNNTLYIDNVASGSTTHYNAIYYFRPVATTAST
ncbi:MAG: hypothetical protein OEV26_03175, partial [Gallionella sp.]|nr:hypothetical protein [Gallionella sp.]